jgi:hypothetical protein
MAIELATIEYNRDAQEWRLYSPGREQMLCIEPRPQRGRGSTVCTARATSIESRF